MLCSEVEKKVKLSLFAGLVMFFLINSLMNSALSDTSPLKSKALPHKPLLPQLK